MVELRFPNKHILEEIPFAGVDFVNRLTTAETVVSATVSCSIGGVVGTPVCQDTKVLFTVEAGTVGDAVITVVATGSLGTVREAVIYMKIIA